MARTTRKSLAGRSGVRGPQDDRPQAGARRPLRHEEGHRRRRPRRPRRRRPRRRRAGEEGGSGEEGRAGEEGGSGEEGAPAKKAARRRRPRRRRRRPGEEGGPAKKAAPAKKAHRPRRPRRRRPRRPRRPRRRRRPRRPRRPRRRRRPRPPRRPLRPRRPRPRRRPAPAKKAARQEGGTGQEGAGESRSPGQGGRERLDQGRDQGGPRRAARAPRAQRRQIVAEQEDDLAGLLRDAGDGAGQDQADMGATSFERDHELTVVNNEREKLAQIDRALARIDDGTYGVCESCGNPIGKMRLMAFPACHTVHDMQAARGTSLSGDDSGSSRPGRAGSTRLAAGRLRGRRSRRTSSTWSPSALAVEPARPAVTTSGSSATASCCT